MDYNKAGAVGGSAGQLLIALGRAWKRGGTRATLAVAHGCGKQSVPPQHSPKQRSPTGVAHRGLQTHPCTCRPEGPHSDQVAVRRLAGRICKPSRGMKSDPAEREGSHGDACGNHAGWQLSTRKTPRPNKKYMVGKGTRSHKMCKFSCFSETNTRLETHLACQVVCRTQSEQTLVVRR